MDIFNRKAGLVCGLALLVVTSGCHSASQRRTTYSIAGSSNQEKRSTSWFKKKNRDNPRKRIRYVRCLYDQKPWISADKAGDRDPEGVHYRVFLEPESTESFSKSVLRDGEFYIEMYRIKRKGDGTIARELVSDWRYPTNTFQTVRSKFLGMGYHVWLRWAKKSLAGNEVEIITGYEDTAGHKVRSGSKRFLVPRYAS